MNGGLIHCDLYTKATEAKVTLCPAFQYIVDQHGTFRKQMEKLSSIALQITKIQCVEANTSLLTQLHDLVIIFTKEINEHSEIEDTIIFPLIAKYLEYDHGQIAVMEFEHTQAKGYLKMYFENMTELTTISDEIAKESAQYIIEVCNLLQGHFDKEEFVLFPTAEEKLSKREKANLYKEIIHEQMFYILLERMGN